MRLPATIVFEQNWDAIHALDEKGNRKYKYIINKGSSRSSKTYSLIDCYDLYARKNHYKRLTVFRSTKKDCKDTVMNDFIKRLKTTERFSRPQYNKTESKYNYTTDSIIEFLGLEEESVFGLTQDAAWFNEPYSVSKDDFDQIDQRTSDFIFIDYNPKEDHWIEELMKHPRALVIHSTFLDNPFCPEESRLKILSYEPLPRETEEEKIEAARLLSLPLNKVPKKFQNAWQNEHNGTANKYKWDVFGLGIKGEVEGLVFGDWKVVDVPMDKHGPIAKLFGHGLDFGYTNDPTALISLYEYMDGVLLDEKIYQTDLRPSGLIRQFRNVGILSKDLIVADRSAPLYIDEIIELGYNNTWAAEGDPTIAYGIDIMKDMKIYVTSRSRNLLKERDSYKNKKNKFGGYMNIPDEGQQDHAIDAARYICTDFRHRVRHATY